LSSSELVNQVKQKINANQKITADDILKDILDKSRLGNNEASQIAKQLAKGDLSSSELVNQVKQKINANQKITADDILKDILDKS
ncbi:hypothetical protein EF901_17505, partial [Staphylococcus aureus]